MKCKEKLNNIMRSPQIDSSRLGIFDAGNLNGTNSDNTRHSYKYGINAPLKADLEAMVNQLREELEITSWEFKIVDVDPIDYTSKKEFADFLFARGAMTINDLIRAFGEEFGIDVDESNPHLEARYINNVPLEKVWNSTEKNPYAEVDSILNGWEGNLRYNGEVNDNHNSRYPKEADISE